MKIRITGAQKESYWYASMIGEVFEKTSDVEGGAKIYVNHRGAPYKYCVNLSDCEVVQECSENITVLKDELGLQREYREVKRKANVGERIKIVNRYAGEDRYINGEIGVVELAAARDLAYDEIYAEINQEERVLIFDEEYVVLEPTDIIRIDDPDGVNRRYRMVARKAAVGERVVIVSAVYGAPVDYGYDNGKIYEVMSMCGDEPEVWPEGTVASVVYLDCEEYRVLEPIESAPNAQLSALPATEQAAENIASLAARFKTLEETVREQADKLRIARLDIALINEGVADEVAELKERIAKLESAKPASAYVKVAFGPVSDRLPSFLSAQQKRDAIVERAKADVRALADDDGDYTFFHEGFNRCCSVEFVINRDKRKVTVILRGVATGKIRAVGRAICAPNDVFNAHIGRAIALRRALGLEVPAEYLSVPNPEEVRVGDVIAWRMRPASYYEVVRDRSGNRAFKTGNDVYPDTYEYLTPGRNVLVIDDSREDSDTARKEVA